MGNGMDKILPGLYVGNLRDSADREQIEKNQITHILSIHDAAEKGDFKHINYLCIRASDCASQDLQQYFAECIEFIHKARISGGSVLVHCLAGVSRSTTIVIAYIMTVTDLSWSDAINSVRGARKITNPNFGFQRQLQNYEFTRLKTEKENLIKKFGNFNESDTEICKKLLEQYHDHQNTLITSSHNFQATKPNGNTNVTEKIYPLAYNAFNVDENSEKSKKNLKSKANVENVETNDVNTLSNSLSHLELDTNIDSKYDAKQIDAKVTLNKERKIFEKFFK